MIKKLLRMSRIYFNPEVYYGKGTISCLKSIEYNNFLLLISNTVKQSDYFKKIESYLRKKSYKEEIIPRPTQDIVIALREKYLDSKPEVIIAIGGGKVIDTTKCLKFLLNNPHIPVEEMIKKQFSDNNEIKLVAIPTTPSTGSEANWVAVITDNQGKKIPYINQGFMPDMAVLDPTFLETFSLSSLTVLASDCFTHAWESMVSVARSPMLKSIGESCMSLLESGFSRLRQNPKDIRGISEVQYAGYLGGILVGNGFVGACHALAHALEKQTSIAHSNLILSLIKPVITWSKNQNNNPAYDKFLKIYDLIGFDEYIKPEVFNNINVDHWIEDSLNDPNMMTNPIRMGKENTESLINWILNNK
ncbi:MAG: iron-containing alcohol dehydrogenase family protein [Promethearchaeota archaeon]